MRWAVSNLCFFRAGELTLPSDVSYNPQIQLNMDSPNNPTIIKVHHKNSKTDLGMKWVDIIVGYTYTELCLITAVIAYLAKRGNILGFLFKFESEKY